MEQWLGLAVTVAIVVYLVVLEKQNKLGALVAVVAAVLWAAVRYWPS